MGNIAQISKMTGDAQAFVNTLAKYFVGQEFTGPDKMTQVSVVDATRERARLEVSLRSRAEEPARGAPVVSHRGRGADAPAQSQVAIQTNAAPVVIWRQHQGFTQHAAYFAPTDSPVRARSLFGAARGRGRELLAFNETIRPWLEPQLDQDIIQGKDFVEFLASHCVGATLSTPDLGSTISVSLLDGGVRSPHEPVIMWSHARHGEQDAVYFVPSGSTVSPSDVPVRRGSNGDLVAFVKEGLPVLEPTVERYLQGSYRHELDAAAMEL